MIRAAVLVVSMLLAGPALAEDELPCHVPDGMVNADFPLPHVAAALETKRLEVAVIGSASSVLTGTAAAKAYPARFEAALTAQFPGVAVHVAPYAKPKQSAAEMQTEIPGILAGQKPSLVVWQTGTADAIRGIDPDEFRDAVDTGVGQLQAGGADVILMNMQFSPRTESMIAVGAYADAMRFVALQHSVDLFDRFAVMKHWNESGIFDLNAATKKTDMAESVHECLGKLLTHLVVEGVGLTVKDDKGSR